MKILVFALLLYIPIMAFSQNAKPDKIYKKDNTQIEAQVLDITPDLVKYKKFSNLTGPVYSLPKSEITLIVYANGESEQFANSNTEVRKPVEPAAITQSAAPVESTSTVYFRKDGSVSGEAVPIVDTDAKHELQVTNLKNGKVNTYRLGESIQLANRGEKGASNLNSYKISGITRDRIFLESNNVEERIPLDRIQLVRHKKSDKAKYFIGIAGALVVGATWLAYDLNTNRESRYSNGSYITVETPPSNAIPYVAGYSVGVSAMVASFFIRHKYDEMSNKRKFSWAVKPGRL